MSLRMTVVTETLLSASSFKLGASHYPTTLCTVYSGCFLKHFNIILRCTLLQKHSKEMLFVHLNTFHMRTKTVTKNDQAPFAWVSV